MIELVVFVGGFVMIAYGLFRVASWSTVTGALAIPVSYVTLVGLCAVLQKATALISREVAENKLPKQFGVVWSAAAKTFDPAQVTPSAVLLGAFLIVLAWGMSRLSAVSFATAFMLHTRHQEYERQQAVKQQQQNKRK
eukprot:PhM_4_TR7976/c0_g1_i2/m.2320